MTDASLLGQSRVLVSLIDKLRDFGLDQLISLPRIVVIGEQSAGKSSLLEQIVGLDFLPRGSGIVTRRPLQIRLITEPSLKDPVASFQELKGKSFSNFAQVKKAIEQLTDKVCGNSKDIVDKRIALEIKWEKCPNLTLVDLPGITKVAVHGQRQDIYQVVYGLTKNYIVDVKTIILCAIPANADLATSDALKLAREIDPHGRRTIGCLTKIDLMDRGTNARKILLNEQISLKMGYVATKNRSQADINAGKSVAESLVTQQHYFATSSVYSSLPKQKVGTSSLVKRLSELLHQSIRDSLPQLMQEINVTKKQLNQQLDGLGPDPSGMLEFMMMQVQKYSRQIKESMQGSSQKAIRPLLQGRLRQYLQIQKQSHFDEYLDEQGINRALMMFNDDAIPGFPSLSSFISLITPIIQDLDSATQVSISAVTEIMAQGLLALLDGLEPYSLQHHLRQMVEEAVAKASADLDRTARAVLQSNREYLYTSNTAEYTRIIKNYQPKKKITGLGMTLYKQVVCYARMVVWQLREVIPKQIALYLLIQLQQDLASNLSLLISSQSFAEFGKIDKDTEIRREQLIKKLAIVSQAENHVKRQLGGGTSLVSKEGQKVKLKIQEQLKTSMFTGMRDKIKQKLGFNNKEKPQQKRIQPASTKPELFKSEASKPTQPQGIRQPVPQQSVPQQKVPQQPLSRPSQQKQVPKEKSIFNVFGMAPAQKTQKKNQLVDNGVQKVMQNQKVKSSIKKGIEDVAFSQLKSQGLSEGWARKGAELSGQAATSETGYGMLKGATKQTIKKKTD